MEPDDATDTLGEFKPDASKEIFELLEKNTKEDLEVLVQYEEGTAGAIMNNNYISLAAGIDVKLAMKTVVSEAPDVETINTSFVIDKNGNLLGTVDLKKLIVTKSPCLIDDIMNTNFKWANVDEDVEDVLKTITDYDIYALPIIDKGILKGIITMDDAADVLVEEAEEDYAKFSGLTEEEEIDEPVVKSIKKRLPWLSILLILDLFVAVIISQFEYLFAIDALTILVIFQPVILGLAGNCGTQSLAVAVRSIGNDELENKKAIFKHLGREFSLGLTTGIVIGIIGFCMSFLLLILKDNTNSSNFYLSLVVSLSIFLSITFANTVGALIPIALYKCKIDPAVASGPFITTINDIISITVYFTLATLLIYNFL